MIIEFLLKEEQWSDHPHRGLVPAQLALDFVKYYAQKNGYKWTNFIVQNPTLKRETLIQFKDLSTNKNDMIGVWWSFPGEYKYEEGIPVKNRLDGARLVGEW